MKFMRAFLFAICFSPILLSAQEKSKVKFGKVSAEDFKPTAYEIDSSAHAVVIAEIGHTEIVGNNKGGFSLEFRRFKRAHILNKNGYDIANVEIELYTVGEAEEDLKSLKAYTYNLENGKVIETKLDVKSDVFKDKISKNKIVKKFTFPNIHEGSIIEFEYTVLSDFLFNLQPWEFQGDYPTLWSEYNVSMPEFFYYVTMTQGYHPYHVNERKDKRSGFMVTNNRVSGPSQRGSFTANVTDFRWVMKDVPALKEESYTSTLRNHIARIEFQLAEERDPLVYRRVMASWPEVTKKLLEDESFGSGLRRDNGWLNDVLDEATNGATNQLEKARNIFYWVRDRMTCTNYNRRTIDNSLRNILKARSGSEAEINLLLVAMLHKADIAADPVMLSTRSNGYAYPLYPLLDRFNYIICRASIGGRDYYLDASHPRLGFGRLSYETYNGHARIINSEATPIDFIADSLVEKRLTSVFMISDDKGNMSGSLKKTPGYFESYSLRNRVKESGFDQYFADIKKGFAMDVDIKNPAIDSLVKYDDPVSINFEFDIKSNGEDIIYFNPMFGEAWKENPFKSAQRFYPVEVPYTIDETFLLRFEVPKGYVIDEMPKQVVIKLNEEGDGFFEYRLSESNGSINLRSRLQIKRAFFLPEEYEMLREFFNMVVTKHSEQFVFKKKS